MDGNRRSAWITGLLVVLITVSGVSSYMGYQALSVSRQAEQDRRTVQVLKAQVDRINLQLAEMSNKLGKAPDRMGRLPDLPPPPGFSPPPPSPRDVTGVSKQGNGVASGKTPKDAPPPVPPPASAEAVSTDQVSVHRQELIERNASLHRADRERYGDRLRTLYEAARSNVGGRMDSPDNGAAFQQMLTEYPEANATGMVIGEKALDAALRANTAAVEEYYRTLSANENFSSLVTDSGVEALPALQGYLAYQYIQQGRMAEAEALLQSLEGNYGSGLVAVPGPRGEPEWRPVAEVVKGLRTQTEAGR